MQNRNLSEDRGTYEQETLAQTKLILKPFFLRRLKTEVSYDICDRKIKLKACRADDVEKIKFEKRTSGVLSFQTSTMRWKW